MKSHTLRFRAMDKKNFEALKSGQKSVETRAATEKYRQIQPGDTLVIVCGDERTVKRVQSVRVYPSIEIMFQEIPTEQIMPEARSLEEARKEYHSYPGYKEKIAQCGLVAFALAPNE